MIEKLTDILTVDTTKKSKILFNCKSCKFLLQFYQIDNFHMCVKYKTLQNLLTPKRYSSAACTVCLTVLCAPVTVRLKKYRVET